MSLKDYQSLGVNLIRKEIIAGRRKIMLWLSTGGGKTVLFCHILKGVNDKGQHGLMVVRGRQLVDQGSKRLFREEVEHGVRMANHWNKNHLANIQVCSIDTAIARQDFPPAKFIIVDEAHLATTPGFHEFLNHYPDAIIISCTATPWPRESMRHLAEVVVHPITAEEMFSQGYLVRPRYFAPVTPDLKGLKKVNGDYVNAALEERMHPTIEQIVHYWKELGQGRPTIGFAVNIKNSLNIVRAFIEAGIPAEHIEGNHSFEQRIAALDRLKRGEIKVLMNVGVLCTGVDMPFVSCIISARPTDSYNLYIQQMGRGTRPDCGDDFHTLETPEQRLAAIAGSRKKDFLILDFGGNVLKHGFIKNEPEVDLDGKQKVDTGPAPRKCPKCYLIYEGPFCTECGPQAKPKDDYLDIASGVSELKEIKEEDGFNKNDEVVQFIAKMEHTRKKYGRSKVWLYHRVREEFGETIADEIYPDQKNKLGGSSWFKI